MKIKFTEPQINIKMFNKEHILTVSGDPRTGVKVEGDSSVYDVRSINWSDFIS